MYGNGLRSKGLRDGWMGWMGFGGSVMQWHPELKIGFAYNAFNFKIQSTLIPAAEKSFSLNLGLYVKFEGLLL